MSKEQLESELARLQAEKERQELEAKVKALKREVEPSSLDKLSKGLFNLGNMVNNNSTEKKKRPKKQIRYEGIKL